MRKTDITLQSGFDNLIRKQPIEQVGRLINSPEIFYLDGVPYCGYFQTPETLLKDLHRVATKADVVKNGRENTGIETKQAVFGIMPRSPARNDYCRFTASSKSQTEIFAVLKVANEFFAELYEKHFPENFKQAMAEITSNVHKSWRYVGSPYLTVNINLNHAIKYHRDSGNFPKALSTVLIVRKEASGGLLCIPEINITLAQEDGAFSLLPGAQIIHGVTPIKFNNHDSYRASIVFYSMKNLKNCYPYHKELERAQTMSLAKFYKQKSPEQLAELKKALERSKP